MSAAPARVIKSALQDGNDVSAFLAPQVSPIVPTTGVQEEQIVIAAIGGPIVPPANVQNPSSSAEKPKNAYRNPIKFRKRKRGGNSQKASIGRVNGI